MDKTDIQEETMKRRFDEEQFQLIHDTCNNNDLKDFIDNAVMDGVRDYDKKILEIIGNESVYDGEYNTIIIEEASFINKTRELLKKFEEGE